MMRHDLSQLGVITVVFNPAKYQTRYERYLKFKDHMLRSGVNLFTVECIFPSAKQLGLPRQNFEITRSDRSNNIQIMAPSILWMKENLINIAASRMPSYVRYIAWIDADVEFEVKTSLYLNKYSIRYSHSFSSVSIGLI